MSSIDYSQNYQLIDKDHVLAPAEYKRLEQSIADVTQDQYQEFIVCFVRSVADRNFREHAMALRRELSKDINTSIILLVSLHDRHAEIATAPRFVHLFTSRTSSALLKKTLTPLMKEGKIAEAITSSLKEICNVLQKKKSRAPQIASATIKCFLIAVIIALLGWIGYIHIKAHLCIECGHWVRIQTVVKQEATYSSPGLEEITYICNHCGTHYKKTRIIPEKSSSSSSSSDSSSDSGSDSGGSSDGGGGTDW
jgi:uncharacterized membrane protein YgcG